MSEENKARELPNPDIFGPPFFGVGLGEKLGSMDSRITRLESDTAEIKRDLKILVSKVDRMDERLTGMDERLTGRMTDMGERLTGRMADMDDRLTGRMADMDDRLTGRMTSLEKKLDDHAKLLWGLFIALLAAIIVQKFI